MFYPAEDDLYSMEQPPGLQTLTMTGEEAHLF